jgi:DNA-binding NarL/FixJ family response regulator
LRLLLVDDHALFRDGLARLCADHDDLEVVGQAESADEALRVAQVTEPDLVLMDLDLPGRDGIAATRELKAWRPELMIVMLTVHDNTERLIEAIKAGAQGYLLKNIRAAELLEQLRGTAQGEAAISRRMATRLLDEFRRGDEPAGPETELSPREIEVLELVAGRLSNKEIAAQLIISEHTVKNHLKHILSKLQLRSRRQAAAYGIARGWVRPAERRPHSDPPAAGRSG